MLPNIAVIGNGYGGNLVQTFMFLSKAGICLRGRRSCGSAGLAITPNDTLTRYQSSCHG
jgi:hypothetical protein